eukprot:TRINITY_DN418_c0_g1_i13.p1 TRINITY_DN418_c0_g1~~TRINITY_DN418_c0_g1_i13.p1  ORF type:complete len:221 (-),score=40.65 TRINITY_DN418_c0_g1_i13:169-831(-)
MSKLSSEVLQSAIQAVLEYSTKEGSQGRRHFVETVELQIGLKNYDVTREKKFNGSIVLPHKVKTKFTTVIIGDQQHVDEATAAGLTVIDAEFVKGFKKDKKKIKKWAKQYDNLIASDSLVRQIPRLAGPQLNKMGKFPSPATHDISLVQRVDELEHTVRFQMKKVLCLACAVGTVTLTAAQLEENINLSINTLVGLLKKGWQNIKSLHVKSTMGRPHRIF